MSQEQGDKACPAVIFTVSAVAVLARAMTGEFAAAWLPALLVPVVGILGPAVAMALLFNVIEARD
jgi:photosystem I subunit 8